MTNGHKVKHADACLVIRLWLAANQNMKKEQ